MQRRRGCYERIWKCDSQEVKKMFIVLPCLLTDNILALYNFISTSSRHETTHGGESKRSGRKVKGRDRDLGQHMTSALHHLHVCDLFKTKAGASRTA